MMLTFKIIHQIKKEVYLNIFSEFILNNINIDISYVGYLKKNNKEFTNERHILYRIEFENYYLVHF